MRWWLVVLLLTAVVRAEDPGPHWIAVLDPGTGRLVAHYRLDQPVRQQIEQGQEVPHYAFLRKFSESDMSPDESQPKWHQGDHCMGILASGEHIVFHQQTSGPTTGELGLEDEQGQFHLLEPKVTCWSGGRSTGFQDPLVAFTDRYVLSEDPSGTLCRVASDGRQLWKAAWHLGHSRLFWGAWLESQALYVDTTEGLSRVDPATGRRLWNYPGAGEVSQVRLSPQGLLFVEFIYPPYTIKNQLGLAAAKRFGWPWNEVVPREGPERDLNKHFGFGIVVIPYRASYFGFTYRGPVNAEHSYDFQKGPGKAVVWEFGPKGWSTIFEYTPADLSLAQQVALYAKNGFSAVMRRRLIADYNE